MTMKGYPMAPAKVRTSILVAMLVLGAASLRAADDDWLYTQFERDGDRRAVPLFTLASNWSAPAGGKVAVATGPYRAGERMLAIPAMQRRGQAVVEAVSNLVRFHSFLEFAVVNGVLAIAPFRYGKYATAGDGRDLAPADYFRELARVHGKPMTVSFVATTNMAAFTVPFHYRRGEPLGTTVRNFCTYYYPYTYVMTTNSLRIFPVGYSELTNRVVPKTNVHVRKKAAVRYHTGLVGVVGGGAFGQVGWEFRLGRFYLEPRLAVGPADADRIGSNGVATRAMLNFTYVLLENGAWRVDAGVMFGGHKYQTLGSDSGLFGVVGRVGWKGWFFEPAIYIPIAEQVPYLRLGAGYRF